MSGKKKEKKTASVISELWPGAEACGPEGDFHRQGAFSRVMRTEQQQGFSEWEHRAAWPRGDLSPSPEPRAGGLREGPLDWKPMGSAWLTSPLCRSDRAQHRRKGYTRVVGIRSTDNNKNYLIKDKQLLWNQQKLKQANSPDRARKRRTLWVGKAALRVLYRSDRAIALSCSSARAKRFSRAHYSHSKSYTSKIITWQKQQIDEKGFLSKSPVKQSSFTPVLPPKQNINRTERRGQRCDDCWFCANCRDDELFSFLLSVRRCYSYTWRTLQTHFQLSALEDECAKTLRFTSFLLSTWLHY